MTCIAIPKKCRACGCPRAKHTPEQRKACSRRTQILTANEPRQIEKSVVIPDSKVDNQLNRRFLKVGIDQNKKPRKKNLTGLLFV